MTFIVTNYNCQYVKQITTTGKTNVRILAPVKLHPNTKK